MSINVVLQSGRVKSPALRYASDGKAEFRWTLEQKDGEFTLWLPCFAPGAAAQRLAEQLDEGMDILITSGRLAYRKRETKAGEQSRLEILTWACDILSDVPQDDLSAGGAVSREAQTEIVAPTPKGKPRYKKWKPEPSP